MMKMMVPGTMEYSVRLSERHFQCSSFFIVCFFFLYKCNARVLKRFGKNHWTLDIMIFHCYWVTYKTWAPQNMNRDSTFTEAVNVN